MRVIAGKWKGHRLQAPSGQDTRPTTDRVKESMFNLLPHQLTGVVVDLFAGSGALGIEACSRGADRAVFVDKNRRAVVVIRENLERIGCKEESAVVWQTDWRQAIGRLASAYPTVEWIFLDPPYAEQLWEPAVRSLAAAVDITGGILCEVPKNFVLPSEINGLIQVKYKVYGDIAVCVYAKPS